MAKTIEDTGRSGIGKGRKVEKAKEKENGKRKKEKGHGHRSYARWHCVVFVVNSPTQLLATSTANCTFSLHFHPFLMARFGRNRF